MELTLRDAAQQVGANKTTLLRAIKAGRLSARRTEAGSYMIDPAELFRVYEPKPDTALHDGAAQRGVHQDASPIAADAAASTSAEEVVSLRIAAARLEAENAALKVLAEELRTERDRWHAQAERLALPAPAPNGEDELRQERDYWREQAERLAMPVPAPPVERRGLLGWFRRAG